MMDNLRKHLIDFEQATAQSRSSSFICGGSKVKDVDHVFRYILGYQQVFPVIGHYQDKNIKQEMVSNILNIYEK